MDKIQQDKSVERYWESHLLAQAAQKAVPGSATRRGLWNAFTKKKMVAETMDQIEEEARHRQQRKK